MRKEIFLIFLIPLIFLAGCIGPRPPVQPITYSNDLVQIEGYTLSSRNPYVKEKVELSFLVTNKGEEKIDWIEVNFYDTQGLRGELECGGEIIKNCPEDCKCTFENVVSGEGREVSLLLEMPEDVPSPTQFLISYSIKYPVTGYKELKVPILDGKTILRPPEGVKYEETEGTYGPVQVYFEPPVGNIRVEDEREIKEYWAIAERPFTVGIRFEHVGSPMGEVRDILIKKENIQFSLTNLEKVEECLRDIYVLRGKLNEIKCMFKSSPISGWLFGVIGVNYDYVYEFYRQERITVQPIKT